MGEPIPLPAFMKGVPEASLGKQEISNEPIRVFTSFSGSRNTPGNSDIFQIPKNHVFEITHVHYSALNQSAPVSDVLFELGVVEAPAGTFTRHRIMAFLLDHNEHKVIDSGYPPLSILVDENSYIRLGISGGAGESIVWVHGYLINKKELTQKKNILI